MSDKTPDVQSPSTRKSDRPRDPQAWIHHSMAKYRKGLHRLEYRPDDAFFELADSVVVPEDTLLGYDRLYVLWQAARNVAHASGGAAEVGAYRGGSAYFIACALAGMTGQGVPMHVIDTFEGHPDSSVSEHDPFQKSGRFRRTSYERVCRLLSPFPHVCVHKGEVETVMPRLPEDRYRLVHIDTDLYRPTLACLAYFGTRLVPGGVIVVDDYASPKCPGVPRAVVEFLGGTNDFQVWDVRTEQLVLVKR